MTAFSTSTMWTRLTSLLRWKGRRREGEGEERDVGEADPGPKPWLLEFRSAELFIVLVVCVAVFTDLFLYSVIIPVIPFALEDRIGVAKDDVQYWVSVLLAVYGAGLLVGSPIFGWAADQTESRRSPLLVGLLALTGATLMLCLGKSLGVMVAGRLLQGLSAAMVWTVGLALMVDTVGKHKIGQSMGYITISISLSVPVALILGGIVYDRAGYYAVFAMSFALLALDIFFRLVMVEKKIAQRWLPPAEETAVEEPSTTTDPEPEPVELPADSPQTSRWKRLPPVLWLPTSRRLLTALWCCLVEATIMAALESVLPLFVERTFHWTSTGAGLIFLAYLAPSLGAPVVGYISDHYGARWLMSVGCAICVPPLVLIRLVEENTMRQKVLLVALLAIIGGGLLLLIVPSMAEMTYLVHAKEKRRPGIFGKKGAYAQAYGLFNMAFAGGTLIGPLWSGFVERKAGWGTMGWTLALFVGVSVVPAVLFTGGWILNPTPHHHPDKEKRQQQSQDQEKGNEGR